MSSRPSRRSKTTRKNSRPDSYSSHTSPPPTEGEPSADDDGYYEIDDDAPPASATTWPPPSFLFAVNELPVNEDRQEGGVPPRSNDNAGWIPPIYSNGFGEQTIGYLYRWSINGQISWANDCPWSNGSWRYQDIPLTEYRASTMFWCNAFTQFLATPGDASMRDMAESDQTEVPDRWWPLTFRHDETLSRIEVAMDQQLIAGTGSWIRRLGLESYSTRRAPHSGGLSGNLAMIIALIAFSCEAKDLSDVLLGDHAWQGRRWHSHRRGDGRVEGRGVVVTIYIDPTNPQGSTEEILYALEWEGERLL